MRSTPRLVFAGLIGIAGWFSAAVQADPPPLLPVPITAAPAPLPVPDAAAADAPALSPVQQKAALREAQRLSLHRIAQATERQATSLARKHQFDQAQALYAHAASLYHQQARMARGFAQQMTRAGQTSLAARAHAEALTADNRYLACLASEVSVLKKSSLAMVPPPKPMLPKPMPPAKTVLVPSLPFPTAALPPVRTPLRRVPAKPEVPRAAGVTSFAPPRGHVAQALSPRQLLHAERARKALPAEIKALRDAAARPLSFAPSLAALEQHGVLQERLRIRRVQLQDMRGRDTVSPTAAPP